MSRFKFVHAADLHLDSPFRSVQTDARLKAILKEATFGAFARIVDLCLREAVDFLVLAGDLFDAKDRSVHARLALRQQLSRLDAAGIQTFIVHGNHDPLSAGSAAPGLPPSVTVFGATWSEVEVRRQGRLLCRVQGISYPQERVSEDLSAYFSRRGPEFTVGVLHANVGGNSGHANYSPCTLEGLASRGLDYWALGHVHTRAELALPGGGVAVYPGNPQGRHANETGERGCMLVEVEEARCARRFFPADVVRWHRVEVDLAGLTSIEDLAQAAEEAVAEACPEGFAAHAVRLVITGRGALHRELVRPGAVTDFQAHLGRELAARMPPVALESVEDASRPQLDLDAIRALGGLQAQLLEVAAEARQSGAAREALWTRSELPKLDSALKKVGLSLPRELLPELIDRAAARALELLAEDPA